MADTSTQEQSAESAPHTNGLDGAEEDERSKIRPADIDADMREMERRKRVELIMNSRLFREELERIIETQMKDGGGGTGAGGLLQQIQDMMGIPKHANVFKSSNCVVPINDIRGVESMGYAKGEKLLRCKLAAVYRLMDLHGWAQGVGNQITARLNQDQEHFIVNPYGMLCHEITASSLVKIDMQGNVVEQGTTNFGVNVAAFSLHAAIHAARPDVKCAIHVHTPAVLAISATKCGLLPVSQESVVIGEVSSHPYAGGLAEPEEREKVARNLGPINKVLLLANHGAVCCGETVEEAFFNVYNTIVACETQLKLMPIGLDNLALVSDETRKQMYDAARKAPDGTTTGAPRPMAAEPGSVLADKLAERKWRVGGVEFEALMRMLDNAGFRTGYIYRHPLIKGDPPRPRNDVEVPPAVSSLGYLLEEEEMYKQGIWKIGRKGNDRTRWLNSPNVYQKVEILETGTPDPKKITKWVDANADEWVADQSPTHSSTPMKIDAALQFVPKNTNPKEFKLLQQQIKDNRRADKISAGPQSHILEGVSWEEAKKMQDAGVTQTGDQVVVVGAASKGIIQRGYQHNAMVYKAPYAKNPFDSVTDEELDEYKKVIEKKAKGEYDTDYSESESAQISSKRVDHLRSPTSADETEEESRDEPRVLRIETKQAPKPSQPEVVLSDDDDHENVNIQLLNAERIQSLQTQPLTSIQTYKGCFGLTSPTLVLRVPNYRSSSHNGMPRGSYLLPNPVHYHVCQYKYISNISDLLRKPSYVTYNEQQQQLHQQRRQLQLQNKHYITINISNISAPVSIDIPLNVVKQFIEPFAKIINHHQSSNSSTSSSNQTIIPQNLTYNMEQFIDFASSEVKSSSDLGRTDTETYETETEIETEAETEEEVKIMRKQRDNLMNDIDNNISILNLDTSFSDVEVTEILEDETISGKILDFARKINHCQFSGVAPPQNIQIWEEETTPKTESNNNILIDSFNTTNDSEYQTADESEFVDNVRVGHADNFSSDTILKSIFEISKDYISQTEQTNTSSKAEEEEDSYLSENGKYIWTNHNCATAVKLISKKIYKYLIRSCIETIETLEFPEIRCYHDAEELFDEIISIFDQFADCFPSENDINKLKKSIMNSIAKNIERHFLIIPLTDNQKIDKIIEEHKFTTLKKFISLLVYILFDKIENPEFQCTHYELPNLSDFDCPESIKFHSTPETDTFYNLSDGTSDSSISQISHSEISDSNDTNEIEMSEHHDTKKSESESITTFLTQKSEKTGSLQYWFMVNDKVINPKRSSSLFFNNKPVHVSPQRLRRSSAPARFMSDAPKILSPIPEEPRRNHLYSKVMAHPDESEPEEQPKTTTDTSSKTSSFKTSSDNTSSNKTSSNKISSNKTSFKRFNKASSDKISNKTSSKVEEENKNYYEICYNFNVSDNYETYSVKTNEDDVLSKLSGIRKSPVKRQNGRILFMKEVTFIPKDNIRTKYNDATIVNSVTFIPKSNSVDDLTSNTYISGNSFNIENVHTNNANTYDANTDVNTDFNNDTIDDTIDEDWMGYESAKF